MNRIVFGLLISSLFMFQSCNKDDDFNVVFEKLQIVDVEIADTFHLGRTYEVLVTFIRPNECTYFQGFDVYPKDVTIRNVTAIGAHYENQECTQEATEVTDKFLFNVIYDQDYEFRFWTGVDDEGNPEYIQKIVVVGDE